MPAFSSAASRDRTLRGDAGARLAAEIIRIGWGLAEVQAGAGEELQGRVDM
jgi:hypothetical protein